MKQVAHRLAARLPSNFCVEDLYQVGVIGLMNAIDRFDASKNTKLKTYAALRIRGSMLDELRANDWVPRSVRERSKKLENAYQNLRSNEIFSPTDKELTLELGISIKELDKFLSDCRPIPLLSIDDLGGSSNDDCIDFYERLADVNEEGPAENLFYKEKLQLLKKAIENLPEREQLVVSLYYKEEMNLKEIACILKITESRVSQIRTKSIAMIRSYLKEYLLESKLK